MADKIVKGYWDCPYCSSREIDGLVDFCPNCGVHKPKDVKYYLKGNVTTNTTYSKSQVPDSDVLSEKELEKAGISKEECDGKHKEWVCDFCGSLNNWADNVCSSCGSQKDESDTLYGGEKKSGEEPAEQQHTASSQDKEQLSVWDKIKSFFVKNRKAAAIVTVIIAVLSVMFFPYKKVVTVKSFAWERNISLEEYRTVQESDWNVPEGGRVYDEKTEINRMSRWWIIMKLSGRRRHARFLTTMRHRLLTVTMETERLQSIRPQLQYTGQRHIRKAMRNLFTDRIRFMPQNTITT